ncbi:chaperone modulator CbpM [Alcanivorax sp. 1008]|uniref:chaperone modulator CbpM n=1 Tax=Alcanivorax sp. 1008 TaxID=2816853 RepID=UPI001D8879E7|nr:chaperone modulator CbpM [Alcanivorax sp. 1008]MCC1495351.1 chaperone modulatory protein CbpM [Alcanivorax sp. 1008]
MASEVEVTVCTTELYQLVAISDQDLAELVGHGIAEPHDQQAVEWQFDEAAVAQITRAVRLRRELQVDWAGIALALELLDELEELRRENGALRRRLERLEE